MASENGQWVKLSKDEGKATLKGAWKFSKVIKGLQWYAKGTCDVDQMVFDDIQILYKIVNKSAYKRNKFWEELLDALETDDEEPAVPDENKWVRYKEYNSGDYLDGGNFVRHETFKALDPKTKKAKSSKKKKDKSSKPTVKGEWVDDPNLANVKKWSAEINGVQWWAKIGAAGSLRLKYKVLQHNAKFSNSLNGLHDEGNWGTRRELYIFLKMSDDLASAPPEDSLAWKSKVKPQGHYKLYERVIIEKFADSFKYNPAIWDAVFVTIIPTLEYVEDYTSMTQKVQRMVDKDPRTLKEVEVYHAKRYKIYGRGLSFKGDAEKKIKKFIVTLLGMDEKYTWGPYTPPDLEALGADPNVCIAFSKWAKAGKVGVLPKDSVINCWEAVLYAAAKSGIITIQELGKAVSQITVIHSLFVVITRFVRGSIVVPSKKYKNVIRAGDVLVMSQRDKGAWEDMAHVGIALRTSSDTMNDYRKVQTLSLWGGKTLTVEPLGNWFKDIKNANPDTLDETAKFKMITYSRL